MKRFLILFPVLPLAIALNQAVCAENSASTGTIQSSSDEFQYQATHDLVQLVNDAAKLVQNKGTEAFTEFLIPNSRWCQVETYIFVLDPKGNMLVHPDPSLEGRNELELKDVNGKPIIQGLIEAASAVPGKTAGWYHYQWPVPGGLLPRWKSTYVQLVTTPDGERYIVGSGMYNDRIERSFVIDAVNDAVGLIEKNPKAAFTIFHDPTGPFIFNDAYIFVLDTNGVELVNPAFPNLEGRNIMDMKDAQGKELVREMFQTVKTSGSGWVNYLWPKPGQSVPTQKSAYMSKAWMGNTWVVVGCGVYLADAPKAVATVEKMTAPELMALVRDAATVCEQRGEQAFPEFSKQGSKWFHGDTYLFVWTMSGTRIFHAANPAIEGMDVRDLTDVNGRPFGRRFLETAASPNGEGWVHYMYPEPGGIFPTWKSTFIKRVTFPSGKNYIIGCGIYNMDMDKTFIEEVVNCAADLVAAQGKMAFGQLRDKTGPFVFMDTYVFVDSPDGIELVNPGQPSVEGKNLIDAKDINGKPAVRKYIDAAMKDGSAWVNYSWFKPGQNVPAIKHTYVRKVVADDGTYIVGSGFYPESGEPGAHGIRKFSWNTIPQEHLSDSLSRRTIFGEHGNMAQFFVKRGALAARHSHLSEEYLMVNTGALRVNFDDREVVVRADEDLIIPSNIPHSIVALEDGEFVEFFSPRREDWRRGEDQYLRKSQAVDKARTQEQVVVMDSGLSPLDKEMETSKVQKISLNTVTNEKAIETKECHMNITRAGSQPSRKGTSDWFTGTVRIDPLFEAEAPSRTQAISVTFEPGARTLWHSHPLGQHLIVTAGIGWVQRWGGPIEDIRPGDVVWIPSGEKHWHGATATTAMTHIAVYEQLDGNGVDWMEPVSDEQYRK